MKSILNWKIDNIIILILSIFIFNTYNNNIGSRGIKILIKLELFKLNQLFLGNFIYFIFIENCCIGK